MEKSDVRELQRQLSETAERLAQLELGFLQLTELAERTTTMLESIVLRQRQVQ